MRPAIEVIGVSKRFRLYRERPSSLKERVIRIGRSQHETLWALRDIDLSVTPGETLGLLGHNGSGKSTLLKCIAGILRPSSGNIRTVGRMAALLELGSGMHPDLTGRENIYLNGSILGLSSREIAARFDDIVAFAELEQFVDNQVKHYSSGMAARLGFAVAINVDPEILLVDEVLSVGDEAFQRKCLDRIHGFQREGRTILLVTHAAELVRQVCDRAAVLDHGDLVTVAEPPEAIRAYREVLLRRGQPIDPDAMRIHVPALRITDASVEYLGPAPTHAAPGDAVRLHLRYEASEALDDVMFGITILEPRGNLLLSTNTELLGLARSVDPGAGEVVVELGRVPLQDGVYEVQFNAMSHDTGVIYDHRVGKEFIEVVNPGPTVGLVDFAPRVVHPAPWAPT